MRTAAVRGIHICTNQPDKTAKNEVVLSGPDIDEKQSPNFLGVLSLLIPSFYMHYDPTMLRWEGGGGSREGGVPYNRDFDRE